ncbi:MAG: methyltransferase domain-containing protein [Dehalococcoidia bacterium]|nr:methyltransferase domain-containing protein [Dehalococcoidia bacterium]
MTQRSGNHGASTPCSRPASTTPASMATCSGSTPRARIWPRSVASGRMQGVDAAPFDAIARYYDLDLAGFDEDFPLYEELSQRSGGPVLELGCGTGRVAAALAAAGHDVMGVDISPAMLERARRRDARAEFVEADIAALSLGRTYPLVIAPLGTLLHIEPEQRREAFAAAKRHLAPEGRFVCDLPIETEWAPGAQPLVCQWTRIDPESGREVSKLVGMEADVTFLTQRVTYMFDELGEAGAVHRTTSVFELSYFTVSEIMLLLDAAGMRCEGVYGGYELGEPGPESERLIVVAAPRD